MNGLPTATFQWFLQGALPGFAGIPAIRSTQKLMQFTPTQQRARAWCLIAAWLAWVILAFWQLGPASAFMPFAVAAVLTYGLMLLHKGRGALWQI